MTIVTILKGITIHLSIARKTFHSTVDLTGACSTNYFISRHFSRFTVPFFGHAVGWIGMKKVRKILHTPSCKRLQPQTFKNIVVFTQNITYTEWQKAATKKV